MRPRVLAEALDLAHRADDVAGRARALCFHLRGCEKSVRDAADCSANAARDVADELWREADAAADRMVAAGLPDPREQQEVPS